MRDMSKQESYNRVFIDEHGLHLRKPCIEVNLANEKMIDEVHYHMPNNAQEEQRIENDLQYQESFDCLFLLNLLEKSIQNAQRRSPVEWLTQSIFADKLSI